jgi:putative ABC transport system permease protein
MPDARDAVTEIFAFLSRPMLSDLRFALRQLVKSPGFAVIAVLTLGLGIGACTCMFSVVDSVLFRQLPFPESDRLVMVRETDPPQFPEFSVAPGNFFDWQAQTTVFKSLAAISYGSSNLTGLGDPQRLYTVSVTANFFSTLGVHPAIGRDFQAQEETSGHETVAILPYNFWLSQFGGRPDAIGEIIHIDGRAFTIVGVLPKNYRFPDNSNPQLYLPAVYSSQERQQHGGHYLSAIGRLNPGVTIDQARGEMALISARLARQYPDTNKGWGTKLTPLLEALVGGARPGLYLLFGAVGILLLISCANVANLLVARAITRAKEMAIRAALGAGRRRILRQLITESLLLSTIGGILGVAIAQWGLRLLIAFAPGNLPRAAEISIDGLALTFTCLLALGTGIAFGLAPSLQSMRANLNATLKEGVRGSVGRRHTLLGILVVAEVALAFVLLVGAGLLVRSLVQLQRVDPGFRPDHAALVSLSLPGKKYASDAQKAQFGHQAVAALAGLPGVRYVGASHVIPFSGDYILTFEIFGNAPVDPANNPNANYYAITPDYFRAMGISLARGRFFTDRDGAKAPRVAIINQKMARDYFPGVNPIGRRINIDSGPQAWREIVGVVGDVKQYSLQGDAPDQMYEPFAQQPYPYMGLVIRMAETAPALSAAAVRTAIATVDPDQPVDGVAPLENLIAGSISSQRFTMYLLVVFSSLALLLAGIGLYGIMAYAVTQRTGEIGIRMALGAQAENVLRLILAQGGRLVAGGIAGGVAGALILARLMASQLFGVRPADPLTFAAVMLTLAAVAIVACLIPARRASRLDPIVALRRE